MSILAGFQVPHPPLIVPEVGKGQEQAIQSTIDSYQAVAQQIAALRPEVIIIISPHSTVYQDYVHVSPCESAVGDLAQFGAPAPYKVRYDAELVHEIGRVALVEHFPAGTEGEGSAALDHGTIVPLHFINQCYRDYKLVRISSSSLPRAQLYRFGMLLRSAVDSLGRRAVVISSGDFSHVLKRDGPYGFRAEGPMLDAALCEILKSGDFGGLLALDEQLCGRAAECGLGGLVMLAGALDGRQVQPRFLSYEGPFGVGYAVGCFLVGPEDVKRAFLDAFIEKAPHDDTPGEAEDVYMWLARHTLEQYLSTGSLPNVPEGLPDEMLSHRAGAFVSLKKHGQLRGCIGTISATQPSLALEIMHNAVSSAMRDPRFPQLRESELPELEYSVDVLLPSEPVASATELDCMRYGVIVTAGHRRGLLLPNLDGVDSVADQLRIACQKAGIQENEPYAIERFEVVRHS